MKMRFGTNLKKKLIMILNHHLLKRMNHLLVVTDSHQHWHDGLFFIAYLRAFHSLSDTVAELTLKFYFI